MLLYEINEKVEEEEYGRKRIINTRIFSRQYRCSVYVYMGERHRGHKLDFFLTSWLKLGQLFEKNARIRMLYPVYCTQVEQKMDDD